MPLFAAERSKFCMRAGLAGLQRGHASVRCVDELRLRHFSFGMFNFGVVIHFSKFKATAFEHLACSMLVSVD